VLTFGLYLYEGTDAVFRIVIKTLRVFGPAADQKDIRLTLQLALLLWAPICWSQELAPAQSGEGGTNPPTQLDAVFVYGTNTLLEEIPLGPNQQPEWTARRRFVTTRIYVQPPWQVETELGWDGAFLRNGKPQHLIQEEIELGLPYRFQLDVENVNQNFEEGGDAGEWHHESNSVELRWALADWGKIPLNPTVNLEWKFNDGQADAYECQLLLGDELGPRWHWGLNLFFEQQIGDDRVREFAASQAVSYTLIDQKVGAGVEMKFSSESDKDSRNSPENKFQIGPSMQWRPTRRTHLDLVPLFGVNADAPVCEVFLFFGFEFGPGSTENERVNPASLRGK
jgi:hypothetical protein